MVVCCAGEELDLVVIMWKYPLRTLYFEILHRAFILGTTLVYQCDFYESVIFLPGNHLEQIQRVWNSRRNFKGSDKYEYKKVLLRSVIAITG